MNFYFFITRFTKHNVMMLGKSSQTTQGRGLYKTEYGKPGGLDYRNNENS